MLNPHNTYLYFSIVDSTIYLEKNGTGLFEKSIPCIGEGHSAVSAYEQPGSQHFFKRMNLMAERRLGNAQTLCSAAEMQLFSHRDEVKKMAEFK